jgi:hypothetical protein
MVTTHQQSTPAFLYHPDPCELCSARAELHPVHRYEILTVTGCAELARPVYRESWSIDSHSAALYRQVQINPYEASKYQKPSDHFNFFSGETTSTIPPLATAALVRATNAIPAIFGLKSPLCNNLIDAKYRVVPYAKHPVPEPTKAAGENFKSP